MICRNRSSFTLRAVQVLIGSLSSLLLFVSHANAADSMKYVSFDAFTKSTEQASYQGYATKEGVKVKSAAEFEKMKAHVISLYKGVKVKNSFMLGERDHVDCVDAHTQPGLRKDGKYLSLAKPPAPKVAKEKGTDDTNQKSESVGPMLSAQKKDADGNVQFCQEGFIPMRRVTLDDLVRYETLGDFLNKYGKAGEKGLPERK